MLTLLALLACSGTPAETDDDVCLGCGGGDSGPIVDTDETGDSAPRETAETGDSAHETAPPVDTGGDTDTVPPPTPPRVILFIGDGMGYQHVAGGGMYAYGAPGTLTMETLPFQGKIVTASYTGVTDSAAAATALATGYKTWNGVLGKDADGIDVTSLVEEARSLGLSAGVVTTDTLTGATPAGFYAHDQSRGDTDAIAAQLAADPPDLVFGGGEEDVGLALASADVQMLSTRDDLLGVVPDGRPLVGVFSAGTFPFVADGYGTEPSLAEMTTAALDILDADPDGFFIMIEGARIDHASHLQDTDAVHPETAAFDEAVAAGMTWAEGKDGVTLLVTADHECGGLEVSGSSGAGEIPATTWRWGQHTNADVPIYGEGDLATTFDGQRLDNTWVHAVLDAAVHGSTTITAPTEGLLVDGRTEDLGAPVTTQTWPTSFGAGYNQLDALRVTSDADGLWIGVDGVFEFGENSALVLLDLDYGAGTGWGADGTVLADTDGELDTLLTAMPYTSGIDGMGFDAAFGSIGGEEIALGNLEDWTGVRGLGGAWGSSTDYWWLDGQSNFDDGNLADGAAAVDAGATGATAGGWEIRIPWTSFYPSGLPAGGASIGIVAVLANTDGSYASNQALPPLPTADEPGANTVLLQSAVLYQVDATGAALGPAAVVP